MSRILETILPESIRNEGMLFVPQVLEDLMRGKLDREFPARLKEGEDPASARTYAFDVARRLYKGFADALTQANYKVVTRKFIVNLLDNAFGWTFDKPMALADADLPFLIVPFDQQSAEGKTGMVTNTQSELPRLGFPVVVCPHLSSLDETNLRFHGWGLSSSSRSATRFAQELLNGRKEYLWAIVTNGKEIRLVRDNPSLTRPSFLSFDIGAILGGNGDFAAFALMWRMLHASRVDQSTGGSVKKEIDLSACNSLWEMLHARSSETGVRALTGLRSGVVTAIEVMGTGFLRRNPSIREALQTGKLSVQDYEQELLRLAYRFLFLFVAEERRLLHTPGTSDAVKKVYREGYSMARLRRIAARYAAGSSDRHTDLYEGVSRVFTGLAHGEPRLGLTALGGIFEASQCEHLNEAKIANADLIAAMRALRYIDAGKKLFPVNYRDMGAEEFGSVYEGILELVPNYTAATQTLSLVGAAGNNRKTTGSYYTPSSLVDKLVESAMDPLIERAQKESDPEKALLALNVIDTSCGSGHFTVAAARRLATALAQIRGYDSSPEAYQRALRDVVSSSIYGVDINPLSVELAKITLWTESVVPGQPLTFLDSHFVCGDATLGIDSLKNLENGIPAAAYQPLPGDDKEFAQDLGKKNRVTLKQLEKDVKSGQLHFPTNANDLSAGIAKVSAMPEGSLEEVESKKAAYAEYLSGASANRLVQAANLFTAAFLLPKQPGSHIPLTSHLLALLTGSLAYEPPKPELQTVADDACRKARVLHWPLVFPTVFENGGFDCILTNPPWDMMQVSEEEFFAPRDPSIALLEGKKRKTAIEALGASNPLLLKEFVSAVDRQDRINMFVGESSRFPLSSVGKLNLYSVITETIVHIKSNDGTAGFIVPTGMCTDESNKLLFAFLIERHILASLYDFQNAASGKRIFDAVHSSYKFSLVTLSPSVSTDFVFYLGSVADLANAERHFTLTADDFSSINPNTRTTPTFRSKQDAELAKKIYHHVGVLKDETKEVGDPWGITIRQGLFNMTTASGMFEYQKRNGVLPLYESKLIHLFDHRWATLVSGDEVRDVTLVEKADSTFEIEPRIWIDKRHVDERFDSVPKKYLVGWRGICRADDVRTIMATPIPYAGVGNSMSIFESTVNDQLIGCLIGDMNSMVHDWCARQKVGGMNLNGFIVKQIATLAPAAYAQADIDFIVPRVLELTYTSNSLKPWAQALGFEGEPFNFDPVRRAILRAELDARYARLYGLNEQELTYILDPSAVYGPDCPSESFRVLKEKEIAEFGEYRTMRMVLDAWRAQEASNDFVGKYKRNPETWDLERVTYLRLLVVQMVAQSSTHQIPVEDLFAAFAALRTPKDMVSLDKMPPVVKEWAAQYHDVIREEETLDAVLSIMFSAGDIAISKTGMVSLVDEGALYAADGQKDVVLDASLALTFAKLIKTSAEVAKCHASLGLFWQKIAEGFYARAA